MQPAADEDADAALERFVARARRNVTVVRRHDCDPLAVVACVDETVEDILDPRCRALGAELVEHEELRVPVGCDDPVGAVRVRR